jgi:hypothetical protein
LQLPLARDVAGDDGGLAAPVADAARHLLADVRLAAGDDDLGAVLGHALGDGPTDPLG